MNLREPCPSSETLAQYLDGGLTAAERRDVEAHIAVCADCFEVIAGAAAFQEQERASGAVQEIRSRSGLRIWRWAAAASVILALASWVYVRERQQEAPAQQWASGWAERLDAGESLRNGSISPWVGGGELAFGSGLPRARRAFRLGVHFFDAEAALGASDFAGLETAWAEILELLPPGSGTSELVARMQDRTSWPTSRSNLRSAFAHLAAEVRGLDASAFDLGTWAEAGRLASDLARLEFLESDIAVYAKAHPDVLTARDPALRRTIQALFVTLDSKLVAEDPPRLQREFEHLIQLY